MKPTILLVEDSKVQKLANQKILITAGYLVLLAADGDEAILLAREARPDLMLLDLGLPKVSGFEVLQTMKRDPATTAIPVIVLSHLASDKEDELKSAGAVAYFKKSKLAEGAMGEAELIELIEQTLGQSRNAQISLQRRGAATAF